MIVTRRVISTYIVVCTLSTSAVLFFAFVQYSLVQGHTFILANYFIPAIVGAIFGILLSRNIILSRHLKNEKDLIVEKNKRIRSFTGTIVHDLKNPVSAIMGLTGLLLEKKNEQDEKTLEYLDLIHKSSSDILENITLVLDKTKLDGGLRPDLLEVGNPYYTIQSAIDKYLVSALEKSISIERKIDKDLPNVSYDKNALDHIISNLISNAIKYSPPKTQVQIYSELLSDRLKIVVQDQGLGMTDVDLDSVFTEFKTLSARPTGNETSTGLGLSIVKQLVEQIGGDISVRSEGKNKGSTFEVTLIVDKP
jgi:signal transduction histidine kinase